MDPNVPGSLSVCFLEQRFEGSDSRHGVPLYSHERKSSAKVICVRSQRKQGRAGLFPMKASQASTSKQGFSAGLDTTGTDFPIGTTIVVDDIQGGAIRVSS